MKNATKTKLLFTLACIVFAQGVTLGAYNQSMGRTEVELVETLSLVEDLQEENSAIQKELLMTKQQKEILAREKEEADKEAARIKLEEEKKLKQEKAEQEAKSKVNTIWKYTTSTKITQPCGLTAEQLNKALVDTGLKGLGQMYLDAERNHGVNAVVLIAIHAHESGWGNSSLARSNNNLGGIKKRGGGWASFSSKGECISYSAKLLGENYLTPQGKFYNGTDLKSVNVKYCETSDWAGKVVDTINTILKRIKG